MTLKNITGNLLQAYKQCVPGKNLCVDQLMNERITNPELRDQWFYTADGEVYSVDNDIPTLRITREATNPVFNHLEDDVNSSYEQLVNNDNYKVLPPDFEAVKTAEDTVTIDLTKLGLKGDNDEWRYLAVDTAKAITKYNAEQQKMLRRYFGPTDDNFTANMKMLRDSRNQIKEIRVYVLNSKYVKEHAKDSAIGRASSLYDFDDGSSFAALSRLIDIDFRLCGVRRE